MRRPGRGCKGWKMSKKGWRDFFGLDDELFYKRKYAFFLLQSQIFSRSEFIIRTERDWRSFFYSLEYPTDRLVEIVIILDPLYFYEKFFEVEFFCFRQVQSRSDQN